MPDNRLQSALSLVAQWALSAGWTAGLAFWFHWLDALKTAGGWREIAAAVLTVVGKSLYESIKKYFTTTAALALAALAIPQLSLLAQAPPSFGICLPATIKTIHDGDTATDVVIELHVQVRYLNCWARELSEPGGQAALASARQAEGKHGRLFIPLDDPLQMWKLFTFGRVLGEFWPAGSNESESERQVRLGFAGTTKKLEPALPGNK